MSVKALNLALAAVTRTAQAKLILIQLVYSASDHGENIYLANATLARVAMCSTRTVQRVMRQFREMKLLILVQRGRSKPNSANLYRMDFEVLRSLSEPKFIEASDADHAQLTSMQSENDTAFHSDGTKGDTASPLAAIRVTSTTPGHDTMVSHHTLILPIKHKRESRARANYLVDTQSAGLGKPSADEAKRKTQVRLNGKELSLDRLIGLWPSEAVRSRPLADKFWKELSTHERRAAIKEVSRFLHALKRSGRTYIPSVATYLEEKRWTLLEPRRNKRAVEAGPR